MMAAKKSYLDSLTEKYIREFAKNRPVSGQGGSFANPIGNLRGIKLPETPAPSTIEKVIGPQSVPGKIIDVLSRPAYAIGNMLKEGPIGASIDALTADEEERKNQTPNAFGQAVNKVREGDIAGALGKWWDANGGAAASGLSGRSKVMPSDALLENWDTDKAAAGGSAFQNSMGKGIVGFGLDVALDPLTYAGPGLVTGVARKIPGVARATEALKKSGNIAKDVAEEAPVVSRAATKADPAESLEAVTTDNPSISDLLSTYNERATESVKKAATQKYDVDGKRVYDFTRLPSLYAKTRAASKPAEEVVESTPDILSPKDWAAANASMPITRTAEGKIIFSSADDTDAATLADVLAAAQRAGNKRDLMLVKELYDGSYVSLLKGTGQTTPDAGQAARAAAARATGGRLERVRGARRAEVMAKYERSLSPEDAEYLRKSRGADDFNARRREILSRVHSPVESSSIADSPSDSFLRKLLGVADDTPTEPRSATPLNPTSNDVIAELDSAVRRQFKPEGFTKRSGVKDVARNAEAVGKGEGIADRGFNKRAQYNLYAGLLRRASSRLKASKLVGGERASVLMREVMGNIDEADAVLRSRGIEPILGSGHSGTPLSIGDILHALERTPSGRAALINRVFDRKKGSIAITNIQDAYALMFDVMREAGITNADEAIDFIRNMKSVKGEEGSLLQRMGWELLKDPGGDYTKTADAIARRVSRGNPELIKGVTRLEEVPPVFKTIDGKVTRVTPRTFKTTNVGGKEATQAVREIVSALTDDRVIKEVIKRVNANSAAFNAKIGYEVPRIADPVIEEFFKTWLRPTTSTGEAITAYRGVDKAVDAAALAEDAAPVSREIAKDVVDLQVADEIAEDIPAITNIERLTKAARDGDLVTLTKVAQEMHNLNAAEGAESAFTKVIDIGENIEASLDNNILRAMFPFISKTPTSLTGKVAATTDRVASKFMPAAGHATIRPAITTMRSVARNMGNYWRKELSAVANAYIGRSDELAELFTRMQQGTAQIEAGSPAERLQSLVKVLFETGEDGTPGATGAFFRNGYDLDHINGKLRQMGLPDSVEFNLDAARAMANAKGTKVVDELADQWKSWKIDDPIDFMARMQSTMQALSGDSAIAREAYRIAKSRNLASNVERAGFKQITDLSGKSVMAKYLPKGAWYHPDIIEEIKAMDKVLRESLSFNSPFGMFVNRYLDPALGMFKSGMTIYRPGHHVRNLVGDEGLSFLADGLQPIKHKHNAIKVMAIRNNYTDWDAMRALQGLPMSERLTAAAAARGQEKVARVLLKGGKKVDVNAVTVQDAMRSRGALPDFVTGEDLLTSENASETVKKIQDAMQIFGGKVRNAAGRVSEARDDYVRISHFLHILEKNGNKFRTLDDALDFAASRVKKWHPDGTDLSNFESKYMRRIFPFYSWTRKSIPLVAESMLMRPGRITVWPKAMYNLAQANGIDINSMGDPFPEDQLFPSFIHDAQTGPAFDIDGKYYSISPGLPNVDLIDQFGANPQEGIASMLSPFIKAPIELATGKNLATGGNIYDRGEYVESTIPGLAQFGSLTGTSPIGSIMSGSIDPKRANVKAEEAGQPQSKVGPFNTEALINWLSGVGVQNLSKPSYINIAEMEARDRAAKEAQQ